MKSLRQLLDRLHPLFSPGGKLEKLYPLYEAGDTFLYTPGEVTHGASHVRDAIDLKRIMTTVVVALLPCIFMAMWNTGYQTNLALAELAGNGIAAPEGWRLSLLAWLGLGTDPHHFLSNLIHGALYFVPLYIVTNIAGGICEVLFSIIRKHEVNEGFLVTGILFPLTLPATLPWWQAATAIAFAVIFGKEVFGGTGRNFINVALLGRAYLYFAHPLEIVGDKIWVPVDGYTAATTLGNLGALDPALIGQGMKVITNSVEEGGLGLSLITAFLGTVTGSMGETSVLACLIGAAILIATGIGSWRIMLAVTLGAVVTAALMQFIGLYVLESTTNAVFAMPPHWHLVVGGFAFGTVFMATDPVTGAFTNGGKWVYGILIGFITVLIRVVNPAYPEGIMLAILFGNITAPLIDYFFVQANIQRRLARSHASS